VLQERVAEIEAAASELLATIGNPPTPLSALVIADALGLAVKRGFPGFPDGIASALRSRLLQERNLIEVASGLHGRDMHEAVAHELGHWTLSYFDLPQSEEAADTMAAALMMPAASFDAAAPLERLMAQHPLCTIRLIEIRRQALARAASPASAG
jgi:hypothetical protein